jgi:hypothetical protein
MNRMTIVFATILVGSEAFGAGGTLRIGIPKVEGDQITIPVVLGGQVGNGVAALDFRLNYNPEVLQPLSASAGAAASSADKRVMANVNTPGEYIVVMMGMNQTTCTSGEVVDVVMRRVGHAQEAEWSLGISEPTLSSMDGTVIESAALPFQAEPDKEPVPPEGDKAAGRVVTGTTDQPRGTDPGAKTRGASDEKVAVGVLGVEPTPESIQERMAAAKVERDQARTAIPRPGVISATGGKGEENLGRPAAASRNNEESDTAHARGDEKSVSDTTGASDAPRDVTVASAIGGADKVERNIPSAFSEGVRGGPQGGITAPNENRWLVPAILAGAAGAAAAGVIVAYLLRQRLFG